MNLLSWIGNVFIVIGLWGIGNRQQKAFLFSSVGETLWIVSAYYAANYALVAICVVFLLMAVRGYWRWQ